MYKLTYIIHPWSTSIAPNPAWSWKIIISSLDQSKLGLRKLISNGSNTNILFDPWISNIPIAWYPTFVNVLAPLKHLTISSFISDNQWNFELLNEFFQSELVLWIISIYLYARVNDGQWIWVTDTHGRATAKAVYKFLSQSVLPPQGDRQLCWKKRWNLLISISYTASFGNLTTRDCPRWTS